MISSYPNKSLRLIGWWFDMIWIILSRPIKESFMVCVPKEGSKTKWLEPAAKTTIVATKRRSWTIPGKPLMVALSPANQIRKRTKGSSGYTSHMPTRQAPSLAWESCWTLNNQFLWTLNQATFVELLPFNIYFLLL